jgi:hypothetical protein
VRRMKCSIALVLLVAIAVVHAAAEDPDKSSGKTDTWRDP